MRPGLIVRLLLLSACVVLGAIYFPHTDAYQLPHQPGEFLDPSSGEHFKEGTLERQFFRFAAGVLAVITVYTIHWIRSRRFTW